MTVVNKVKLDVIALRRQRVKSLRERGLNLDEITQALAREIDDGGMRNADTGEPFERSTIARDLQWLRTRDFDLEEMSPKEHRARILAEMQEVKRFSYSIKDARTVLRTLMAEARLTSANPPTRVQHSWEDELMSDIRRGLIVWEVLVEYLGEHEAAVWWQKSGLALPSKTSTPTQ